MTMNYLLFGLSLILAEASRELLYEEHLKQLPKRIAQVEPQVLDSAWLPLRVEFQYISDTSKYAQIIDPLLDVAKSFFGQALLVQRNSTSQQFGTFQQSSCGQYYINQTFYDKQYDADMVFFVQYSGSNFLAAATACAYDPNTLRPRFGVLLFGQLLSQPESNITDDIQYEKNVETTIHECFHGLGFTSSLFPYYRDQNGSSYKTPSRTKDGILLVSTPRVLGYTKQYYNCPSAIGLPLEDQGGSGTKDNHWERRILFNELMTGSDMTGDFLLSIFTMSLMEDSGWYRMGDFVPDTLTYGYKRGCDYLYNGCKNKLYPEFCNAKQTDSPQCSYSETGIAYCDTDKLSNGCKYYQIYGNLDCRDTLDLSQASGQMKRILTANHMFYGYNSKCFTGSLSNDPNLLTQKSCHKFQCSTNYQKITVFVGDEKFSCNKNNQLLTSKTKSGQIKCPSNIQKFCNDYSECPNQCNLNGFCVAKRCYCKVGYTGPGCETKCAAYSYLSRCVIQCPSGSFANDHLKKCQRCPYGCSKCSSIGKCTSCKIGFKLQNNGFCDRDFNVRFTQPYLYQIPQDSEETQEIQDEQITSLLSFASKLQLISIFLLLMI